MKYRNSMIAALAGMSLASCDTIQTVSPTTVASQDEAAQVLVSVANVAAWDQVAAQMQPNFALTGDQALLQVLPVTARIQEQVLSAFGASLGIGLPQSTSSSTSGTTSQQSSVLTVPATGPSTTTSSTTTGATATSTDATAPGTAPAAPTGIPAGGALPAATLAAGEIGTDPLLKYQAARDLFESVQMMNKELQNAAVLRCYVPFLVRIRLAVAPYRPNLGYVLNTRIGFFPNEDGDVDESTSELKLNTDTGIGQSKLVRAETNHLQMNPCTEGTYLPQVVPLIAADDIERAMKSRAVEVAQQFGISLSAMSNNIGANAGVNKLNQQLNAIAAQDFNSRLTISRQSDNTLFVRIGATNQATAGAALAPQNYDIAVLLLAPRAYFKKEDEPFVVVDRQIQIVSHTQFRNANSGEVLPDRPPGTLVRQADAVMRQILVGPKRAALLSSWNNLSSDRKETVARTLASPIQSADFTEFENLIAEPIKDTGGFSLADLSGTNSVNTLWVAASTLLSDTALKSAYFQLRPPADIQLLNQTAIVFDDGKTQAKAQLQALGGNSASALVTKLTLTTKGADVRTFTLPAQAVAIDPVSHVLTATFMSPGQLGISDIDYSDAGKTHLQIASAPCATELLCPRIIEEATGKWVPSVQFPIIVRKAEKPESTSKLKLTSTTTSVVADKSGSGSLSLSLSDVGDQPAVLIVTSGTGTILSATDGAGAPLPVGADGSVTVTKDTLVRLKLENLRPNVALSLGAGPREDKKVTSVQALTLAVVANS